MNLINIIKFRRWLAPIIDTVLDEFEQIYHLLHCFPDISSLVEPVARIEEREATPIPD